MTDRTFTLLSEIQMEKDQLTKLVGNQRERLRYQDVYSKSCELDQLIVQYMRIQLRGH